jgi:hypothetical protein
MIYESNVNKSREPKTYGIGHPFTPNCIFKPYTEKDENLEHIETFHDYDKMPKLRHIIGKTKA